MSEERAPQPRPPADLRPAQLGIVLVGRVILGHVTATIVDLAQRGFLGLDETHEDVGGDWFLTDRRAGAGGDSLLDFERTLLDGLFYGNSLVRVSGLGETFLLPLNQMRKQLRRDAVRNGRLRRWGRGRRTSRGRQLLHQIHEFRRELRTLAAAGDAAAMAGLAPYAVIFGLTSAAGLAAEGGDSAATDRRDGADDMTWEQSTSVAQGMTAAFRKIRPIAYRVLMNNDQSDFAHEWSRPHEHQAGHGHGQQQSYSDSYGHASGGGHVGGGGHGGH